MDPEDCTVLINDFNNGSMTGSSLNFGVAHRWKGYQLL